MSGPAELRIILCEYAANNRDGTYTIVRGGLDFWESDSLPVQIACVAVLEMSPGTLETGRYRASLELSSATGVKVWAALAEIDVTKPALPLRVILPCQTHVQSFGMCRFVATIDGKATASTSIEIRRIGAN